MAQGMMTLAIESFSGKEGKRRCREFVSKHHYSGKCPGVKYGFGLYEHSELVGCIVFSIPASYTLCRGVCGIEFSKKVVELSRLAIITSTKNSASYFIGNSLRKLPDLVVVSYADCNHHVGHVGYVYQATNWIYTGHGSAEPIWKTKDGTIVSYTRRHIDTKAAGIGLDVADLVKEKQVGKHRYVTFTGTKRFRRIASMKLRYPRVAYPKGITNRHYGCAFKIGKGGDA